jgi:hypothetical protein
MAPAMRNRRPGSIRVTKLDISDPFPGLLAMEVVINQKHGVVMSPGLKGAECSIARHHR